MKAWVYVKSKGGDVWTVGFYRPDGQWEPESDHDSPEDAAKRIRFLNGGNDTARNVPAALVDCGCQTTVYQDGSGVEIHYCNLHAAAPELLAALKNCDCPLPISCKLGASCERCAAIAKAEGR